MNGYEIMYIVHPDVDEDGLTAINEQVNNWISGFGGEVLKTDVWGRRRLAYPIKKQTEGSYVVLDMQLAGDQLLELERNLKLNEQVLRHLIVRHSA